MAARRTAPPLQIKEPSVIGDIVGLLRTSLRATTGDGSGAEGRVGAAEGEREVVTWVRFDVSGRAGRGVVDGHRPLLILGYANGIQVWDTEDLSNVSEVLSLRDVRVGVATVLAPPCAPHPDRHDSSRPLLAMVDADLASDAPVRILSLHTGRFLDAFPAVAHPVLDITSSDVVVAIVGRDCVTLLDSGTFAPLSTVRDCMGYTDPNRGWGLNPIALGASWLAYGSSAPVDPRTAEPAGSRTASGGAGGDNAVAAIVGMAQQTGTDLWYLGGAGVRKVADLMNGTGAPPQPAPPTAPVDPDPDPSAHGMVRVVAGVGGGELRTVAYFRATAKGRPLAALAFDQTGMLLAAASIDGQVINVFTLAPNAGRSSSSGGGGAMGRVAPDTYVTPQHVYKLVRGVTTALVRSIEFSSDDRWVTVCSDHGTTHLFAVLPGGGDASGRTHVAAVPSSRFETTAGLGDPVASAETKWPLTVQSVAKIKHPQMAPRSIATPPQPASDPDASAGGSSMSLASTGAAAVVGGGRRHVTRRLHGAPVVCFRRGGGTDRDRSGVSMPLRVLGVSLDGTLLEYGLLPHLTDKVSTQAARDHAKSLGGVVVHWHGSDAPVRTALSSTLQTVGHVIHGVRDMVGPASGRGGTPPFGASGGAGGVGQQVECRENFSVLCLASRWWDLCRRRGWATSAGRIGRAGASEGAEKTAPIYEHGWEQSFSHEGPPSPARRLAWLSQVDMATYATPHRRLWMGPQFSVHRYSDVQDGQDVLQGALMQGPLVFNGDVQTETPQQNRVEPRDGAASVRKDIAEALGIATGS